MEVLMGEQESSLRRCAAIHAGAQPFVPTIEAGKRFLRFSRLLTNKAPCSLLCKVVSTRQPGHGRGGSDERLINQAAASTGGLPRRRCPGSARCLERG